MELPWQTNWTKKMKTNMTANRLLNTPIGDSYYVSPPHLDTSTKMYVTIGEFAGFQPKAGDEEKAKEDVPKFINQDTMKISMEDYAEEKATTFDMMETPGTINNKTKQGVLVLLDTQEGKEKYEPEDFNSIMNNTYVKDYIHIHHPSIRGDWLQLITGKPLAIKPPPHFFSQ